MPVGGNFTNCNCGPDTTACENPTQPVATVGLCLADGTPIAVTVVRDCAGTANSEGWLNLATGAWSAGPPPAGVVACGDSRSITTNGTFCDVLEDGTVAGLVLVEYQYAGDGSVASVRLVDAVTGQTYTPTGEVTTCPSGVEQPERDILQLCDVTEDGTTTAFVRDYARDEAGQFTGHADYTLDGQPYTPAGTVGLCQPEAAEPCASTVTVLRLCDLDPDVEPDEDGRRCAVPFLRHLVHDCTGALVETRDTATDGVTPYTATEAVDCGGGGGVPAMVEVPWEVVSIVPDPASPVGRGLIFTLSPIDDPSIVGAVKVTTSSSYGTSSCPADPPAYAYRNPTAYTFTPDQALRDAATYVRCDLQDFDTFEPVTNLTPPPNRLGGTAYWDGTTVRPTESNKTGEMYYDGPPESWTYRVGNTGGGNSCSMLSFAAVSLRAEGCCAGCGGAGGGESGRTVQEVCVIANAAPADVMQWTRVIEAGGATIYYLDQNGDRYDSTLPAGHQIVACPAEEPEPCREVATVLLCDLPDAEGNSGPTTATDTTPIEQAATTLPLPGGAPALWSGGTVVFPADPDASATDGASVYRTIAAALQADRPVCDDGTARVTASLRIRQDGPAPGVGTTGRMNLYASGTRVATVGVPAATPVGYEGTLTLSHTVDAAALAAGDVTVELRLETFHGGGKAWTVDQFTSTGMFATGTCETQFLRRLVTDCDTGEVVSVTDTTLDGQPYEVTGEVGQCEPVAECCDPPVPEPRVDVETQLLCIRDADGEITGQALVEHVYDDQTGERTEQRLTDPTTGDPVTLPAGAELVACQEPACPTAFSTECVGIVERSEASYDNTSMIGGVPGQCGGVQGPDGQFPCQPTTGGLTITSWMVNGEEVIGEGGRAFAGGPCGTGTTATPGMHLNWAAALTNLDPSGATWSAQSQPGCAWFVGSTGGTSNTYGPMVVEDAQGQEWTLTPAQSCEETQFTKVYSQDCDGSITVSWLDADGVETDAPEGDQVPCGTGCGSGGGRNLDVEPVLLCDVAGDGTSTPFLRHFSYGSTGQVTVVVDTALDGFAPYTPTGTVGVCDRPEPLTVLEECRCDDTDGDGAGDTSYVELIAVEEDGTLRSIGTYAEDLSGPYTPVSPAPCGEDGAPQITSVQGHRVQLAPGASWSADSVPTLQSVTLAAHNGTGTITTGAGESTLFDGESVTWSVVRDDDALLVGPLAVAVNSGVVTVTYTQSVTA